MCALAPGGRAEDEQRDHSGVPQAFGSLCQGGRLATSFAHTVPNGGAKRNVLVVSDGGPFF